MNFRSTKNYGFSCLIISKLQQIQLELLSRVEGLFLPPELPFQIQFHPIKIIVKQFPQPCIFFQILVHQLVILYQKLKTSPVILWNALQCKRSHISLPGLNNTAIRESKTKSGCRLRRRQLQEVCMLHLMTLPNQLNSPRRLMNIILEHKKKQVTNTYLCLIKSFQL